MSLYLSSLVLSHFRSHQLARLSLDGRPVALFGPNGSGKTNLIEAVSLLSPGRGLRRASAQEMTRRPEAIGWKLGAVLHHPGGVAEVEVSSREGAARMTRLDDKPVPQTGLGKVSRVLWLVPAMDRLWIEGADGRRRFLDRMTLSFEPSHAEVSLAYERAMRERNRLLKDMVRDPAWYGALEGQMAEAGVALHNNRKTTLAQLELAQGRAQTRFPAADLRLVCDMPETVTELREALADNRMRDLAAGRSLIGPHRADLLGTFAAKGVPARDCSTGEQKALLVSLILANARALVADFGAPPLLLLDEVAAHLDADRRAALYDEVCALGAQAWMTGTETTLFDALGDRAQYVGVDEAAGISQVRQMP